MTTPIAAISEATNLTFEYEPLRDEFVNAYIRVLRRRLWKQVMFSAIAVAGLAMWIAEMDNAARVPLVMILGLTIYSGVTVFPRTRAHLRRHWKNHPFSGAQVRVCFTEEGVRSDSWNGYTLTRWHGFTHYEDRPESFLLYRGPQDAQIYPKRAMTSELVDRCRQMLQAYVGRTKYVKPVQAFAIDMETRSAEKSS